MEYSRRQKNGSGVKTSKEKSDSRFVSDAEAHYDIDGVSYWNGKVIVASGDISASGGLPSKKNLKPSIPGKVDQ